MPRARTNLRTSIVVSSLTPDFYPTILVSKNVYQAALDDPVQRLIYPNFAATNFTMGDNFTMVA